MDQTDKAISIEVVLKRLNLFFTDTQFTFASVQEGIKAQEIIYMPYDFVTYLQTSMLDEKLLEVRFDDAEALYLTKIIDSPPEEENISSVPVSDNTAHPYKPGEYISNLDHITTLPLEPGIGNYHIRNSQKITMRMFTKSFAFEIGTYFRRASSYNSVRILEFDFPVIGRLLHGKREYRAKVTSGIDLSVILKGKRKQPDINTCLIDISASGIAISLKKSDAKLFFIGERRKISIIEGENHLLASNGKVIHITAVRKHHEVTYICGIQLDLVTRDMIAKVESIVAKVQRAHLLAISGLSRDTGFKLII